MPVFQGVKRTLITKLFTSAYATLLQTQIKNKSEAATGKALQFEEHEDFIKDVKAQASLRVKAFCTACHF